MSAMKRSVLKEIATAIPAIFIIEGGIAGITGAATYLGHSAGPTLLLWLGCIEAILGVLFMFRKTLRIALLGLNCYFIATIAAGAAQASIEFMAIILLVATWISVCIRDGAVLMAINRRSKLVLGITIRKKN